MKMRRRSTWNRGGRSNPIPARRIQHGSAGLWSAVGFLALCVSLPAQTPSAPRPGQAAPSTATLSGRVVDFVTNEPVPGVLVQIGGPAKAAKITAENGTFEFTSLPAGSYRLSASRNGYLPDNGSPRPGARGRTTVDLEAGGRGDITVRLVRGGVIAGQVLDADGRPVQARVGDSRATFLLRWAAALATVHARRRSADHRRRGAIPRHRPAARTLRTVGDAHRRGSPRHEPDRPGDRCPDPHLCAERHRRVPSVGDRARARRTAPGRHDRAGPRTSGVAFGGRAPRGWLTRGGRVDQPSWRAAEPRRGAQLHDASRIDDGRIRTIPPRQRHAWPIRCRGVESS